MTEKQLPSFLIRENVLFPFFTLKELMACWTLVCHMWYSFVTAGKYEFHSTDEDRISVWLSQSGPSRTKDLFLTHLRKTADQWLSPLYRRWRSLYPSPSSDVWTDQLYFPALIFRDSRSPITHLYFYDATKSSYLMDRRFEYKILTLQEFADFVTDWVRDRARTITICPRTKGNPPITEQRGYISRLPHDRSLNLVLVPYCIRQGKWTDIDLFPV